MMKRSRSVFEPRTAPMCADFEDAGVAGAMSRLLARLRQLVLLDGVGAQQVVESKHRNSVFFFDFPVLYASSSSFDTKWTP